MADKDTSSDTLMYKKMAKIILGRLYFECGDYQKAYSTIEESDYKQMNASSGYLSVLIMVSISIKAMSVDLLGNKEESLVLYHDVAKAVNASTYEKSALDWAEQALYRGTLLALSDQYVHRLEVPHVMCLIRAYTKLGMNRSNSWKTHKRLIVSKYSAIYLSNAYACHQYEPPVEFGTLDESKSLSEAEYSRAKRNYDHQIFSVEIMELHTTYEQLVYTVIDFPQSGKINVLVLDFVKRLTRDFELVGGTEAEKRGYIEVLHRASSKTFNSPSIMRYLFRGLFDLGDYGEAERALHTYLYLVGLEPKVLFESRSKTPALAVDSSDHYTPVPTINEEEEIALSNKAKRMDGPKRLQEDETAKDKVEVLVLAVRMYCKELGKGAEAAYMAEMAEDIYRSFEIDIQLKAEILRVVGAAFGYLASQTMDQVYRPKYHERALSSLKKSIELDNKNWKGYYQIALQLAEMRDIFQSIQMITESIRLNTTYLPSWHLLVLLCTCPVKENMDQAIRTCEMALQEASSNALKDNWIDYSEDIAEQISMQITRSLLLGKLRGLNAEWDALESLFQVFGKIVIPELIPDSSDAGGIYGLSDNRYGTVLSGSLGNISIDAIINEDNRTRGRSTSVGSLPVLQFLQKDLGNQSVSSFTGRKLHLAEMFGPNHDKVDTGSIKSVLNPSLKQHGRLHLLKNRIRRSKKEGQVEHLMREAQPAAEASMTSLQSIAPSLRSARTLLSTSKQPDRPTMHAILEQRRSCRLLCNLWLLSADSFMNAGKLNEAMKAVEEAETIDRTTHPGVWCLLGRIYVAQKQVDKAIEAFQKGLSSQSNDVECRVWLSRMYMEKDMPEIAEGYLKSVTEGNGWDCPSAWYYLGEIYKNTNRLDRTKDCLFYALELESTKPIQPFNILPRIV
ncbi:hypothetical protein BDB01DRAFT_802608 [Pilobolus umbonatus]|nr:hypothetical protein BDB01DRAFT_802608 [Pilobolus umbonatus]